MTAVPGFESNHAPANEASQQDWQTLVSPDMAVLNTVIAQNLSTGVPLVAQVAQYIIQSGGKRMRPALVLLVARALGANAAQMQVAYILAAVVEFIHTATLLHDDVVDESSLRRGRPTAHEQFGNATAVLVGDFLYSRAFQMMVGTGLMPVMQVLADATNTIAEGEVLQLMNCGNIHVTEADYFRVIEYKTARLFDAACRLGAIAAEKPEHIETMGQFGMQLGMAFQLIDDLLDYQGDTETLGKQVGDDLREGKPTLPLIYAMKHGSKTVQESIRWVLGQASTETVRGEEHTEPSELTRSSEILDLSKLVEELRACGALQHTQALANGCSEQAQKMLENLSHGDYSMALSDLCAACVQRFR